MMRGKVRRLAIEILECIEQLSLVFGGEVVDIFLLSREAVRAPDKWTLELGGPSSRDGIGETAGLDSDLGASTVFVLFDLVANVGELAAGFELGLLGTDPIYMKLGAETL